MLQLQQAFSGLTPPTGGQPGFAPPAGGLDFSNLLGGGATSSFAPAAPVMPNPFHSFPFGPPAQPSQQAAPGERFRNQLQSLNDMGFTDRTANISALVSASGNVNRAIEILLEGPPAPAALEGGNTGEAATAGESNDTAGSSEQTAENETDEGHKGASEKKND